MVSYTVRVCACVRAYVRACVRACVRALVCVCVALKCSVYAHYQLTLLPLLTSECYPTDVCTSFAVYAVMFAH